MSSVNKVILIGYVGKDPAINLVNNESKVVNLNLATTERGFTTKGGVEVPEKTEWHRLQAWSKTADFIEKYVKKGSQIYVEGKLRTRSYESNGTKYITEILIENIQLIGKKQESNSTQSNNSELNPNPSNQIPKEEGQSDDLPF